MASSTNSRQQTLKIGPVNSLWQELSNALFFPEDFSQETASGLHKLRNLLGIVPI